MLSLICMPKDVNLNHTAAEELWTYSPKTETYYLLRDGKVVDTWKQDKDWVYNPVTDTYYKIREGKIVGQWRPNKEDNTR